MDWVHVLNPADHPWLDNPRTAMLWKILQGASDPVPALLFVGGCVRNAIQGRGVIDCDLATLHPPHIVIERLKAHGVRVIPTGIDHGTVTAILDGESYEITTLRKDVITDGRHAVVEFGTDWGQDAKRRDFTLNALYADRAGRVFDPLGTGLADARAGHVRFIGNPTQRIREDRLRIIRFIRFSALYGQGTDTIDAAGLAACITERHGVHDLSRERITAELFKILVVDECVDIMKILSDNRLLPFDFKIVYPHSDLLEFFGIQKKYFEQKDKMFFLTRLPILLSGVDSFIDNFMNKLSLSNEHKNKIMVFCNICSRVDFTSMSSLKKLIYQYNHASVLQAAAWHCVYGGKMNGPTIAMLEELLGWEVPVFPITGDDLIRLGFQPGPRLGACLRSLEKRWIASDFLETKEALLSDLTA